MGGYSDLVDRVGRRAPSLGWKTYFLFGIVAGSLLFSFLAGSWRVRSGYGWLSDAAGDGGTAALLLVAGILVGIGAKTAGGCCGRVHARVRRPTLAPALSERL